MVPQGRRYLTLPLEAGEETSNTQYQMSSFRSLSQQLRALESRTHTISKGLSCLKGPHWWFLLQGTTTQEAPLWCPKVLQAPRTPSYTFYSQSPPLTTEVVPHTWMYTKRFLADICAWIALDRPGGSLSVMPSERAPLLSNHIRAFMHSSIISSSR